MHSLTTTYPNGKRTYYQFEDERALFFYLEEKGVTYYSELGGTVLADGTVYEYGQVGK